MKYVTKQLKGSSSLLLGCATIEKPYNIVTMVGGVVKYVTVQLKGSSFSLPGFAKLIEKPSNIVTMVCGEVLFETMHLKGFQPVITGVLDIN